MLFSQNYVKNLTKNTWPGIGMATFTENDRNSAKRSAPSKTTFKRRHLDRALSKFTAVFTPTI